MENSAVMPAKGGVLKEVLSTPFVKDIIRSSLQSRKPDKSHPLVVALIWQDPEVILSILGSIPPTVNSCVGALAEVEINSTKNFRRNCSGIISAAL